MQNISLIFNLFPVPDAAGDVGVRSGFMGDDEVHCGVYNVAVKGVGEFLKFGEYSFVKG